MEDMLDDVEKWFLVNQKARIMEFIELNKADNVHFAIEVYPANVLATKILSLLHEDSVRYCNLPRILVNWAGHRTQDCYNCAIIRDDELGVFKVIESSEMEANQCLNRLDAIYYVSLLPDGRNII